MSHDLGKDWSKPIAFLWVDGGHDYDCVAQDIADFVPHVVPGGAVVFDDVNEQTYPGVVRAVHETIGVDPTVEHLGLYKNFDLYRRRTQ